jgi:transcription elongation factor GreB
MTNMKSKLITRDGFELLKKELDYLWKEHRPDITRKVSWAASLGDRSENADYQYNKKLLREIDRRIRYLTKRFEELQVIDYSPVQDGKVFFGAWVDIESPTGEQMLIRIVGPDEIYGRQDYVSIDAPIACALLKKAVDDDVIVHTPKGDKIWYVNQIRYVLDRV